MSPRSGVEAPPVRIEAGPLCLSLNGHGCLCGITDRATGDDHINPALPSPLLRVRPWRAEGFLDPVAMRVRRHEGGRLTLDLSFAGGASAAIAVQPRAHHIRMELLECRAAAGVEEVRWGPYATAMEGPPAEYLGLNRCDSFCFGALGLDLNTNGAALALGYIHAAGPDRTGAGGSWIELCTRDRSRTRAAPTPLDPLVPVRAAAVPGLTAAGSSVAFFGCAPGRALDVIEAIELAEELPHPILDGRWAKRAPRASESAVWIDYDARNIDGCVALTREAGLRLLCRFRPFANWGAFEPLKESFPAGRADMRRCAERASAQGVRTIMYTLSTFLRSVTEAEPLLAPVPDRRLQVCLPAARLAGDLSAADTVVRLAEADPDTFGRPLFERYEKVLRIGDEFIRYGSVAAEGAGVRLADCERGFYGTAADVHRAGAEAVRVYCGYWACFFPGTEDMNRDVGLAIGRVARELGATQVTLDGLEGTRLTGHDHYSEALLFRTVYDALGGEDRTYSASTLDQYAWHMTTYISWGEYDKVKGFRGSMLDYRLWRLAHLRDNFMPAKLGQHYPDAQTSVEDIEWLMGLAAGYGAGVELHFEGTGEFRNPARDAILAAIRNWEAARLCGAFSDAEKLMLRQTDCLFTLARTQDGRWQPRFVRRWRHAGLRIEPASAAGVKAVSPASGGVSPCDIDFGWAHDPGIYARACITDTLLVRAGTEAEFEVVPPWPLDSRVCGFEGTHALLVIVRLPGEAAGGIEDIGLMVNDDPARALRIRVRLEPGQYLSTTHEFPVASVYGPDHAILGEVPTLDLPRLGGARPFRLRVSARPSGSAQPELRLNLRFHDPIR